MNQVEEGSERILRCIFWSDRISCPEHVNNTRDRCYSKKMVIRGEERNGKKNEKMRCKRTRKESLVKRCWLSEYSSVGKRERIESGSFHNITECEMARE